MRRQGARPVEEKVLAVFFRDPAAKIHLRELARQADVSAPSTSLACEQLIKKGLLQKEETPPTISYSALKGNSAFRNEKRLWNLRQITSHDILDYLAEVTPEAIVLYGSYSRGEDSKDTPIEIAIVNAIRKPSLEKYEKYLSRQIHVTLLKKPFSKDLANNVANGIVLQGRWDVL